MSQLADRRVMHVPNVCERLAGVVQPPGHRRGTTRVSCHMPEGLFVSGRLGGSAGVAEWGWWLAAICNEPQNEDERCVVTSTDSRWTARVMRMLLFAIHRHFTNPDELKRLVFEHTSNVTRYDPGEQQQSADVINKRRGQLEST